MANRRRARQEDDEWTKDDETIAQFVRFNCPTESTLFHGNEVHYFNGSKAVDTLLESKYGVKAQVDGRFCTRRASEDFMQIMLERKMIWRAKKLVPKKKEKNEDGKDATKSPKMKEPKGKKEKAEDKKREEEDEVDETDAEKKEEDKGEKKKKVKLVEHPLQHFNDANDCYVWIYDPTPLYKKLIGILMIVGAIGCCCFPLWPPIVRQGVYYLSMTGIGFFGVIIGVAIARTILFGLIWLVTGGEHKLWILPNLTEDVGFFESFKPWYSYERASELEKKKKERDEKKKGKKEKNSDNEAESEKKEEKKEKESEESKDASQTCGSASDNSEDDSQGSDVDEEEANEVKLSAPPTPATEQPRKRRPRKDDGDFVIVNK
ncbi:hypothetical protein PENTCL1PPCAC_6656 [Pristionchus entomophagus]|uniref:Translocation protein SEC62 n=1 Tax=Pristionchus entomophagus TaxID=358040 RepID=A0AAV5SMM2_9BILA|nr:hypothetical protein PENTCL1PPCAC_6656 [Pristionchus entomophagus]